jgi:hypothetical protein
MRGLGRFRPAATAAHDEERRDQFCHFAHLFNLEFILGLDLTLRQLGEVKRAQWQLVSRNSSKYPAKNVRGLSSERCGPQRSASW